MHGASNSAGQEVTPNKGTSKSPKKRRRPQRWLLARRDFRAELLYRFMDGPEELVTRFERIRRRKPKLKDRLPVERSATEAA